MPDARPRITLRAPTPSDAADLAESHVRAWQAAYAGLVDADYLDAMDVARYTAGWGRRIESLTDDPRTLAAVVDGRPRGFVVYGTCRDDAARGEVWALNLHPDAWGLGAGSALLRAAHDGLAATGRRDAVLWVVPGNARARRFYEAHGWTDDGVERTVEVNGITIDEVRYARTLPPPPPTVTTG